MSKITDEFKTKLELARANNVSNHTVSRLRSEVAINDTLKRESIRTMDTVVNSVVEELGLDEERYAKRLATTRRSPYGRVCEQINILASIYAWPIENSSQVSEIPEMQERVLDTLTSLGITIEGDLLLDIKDAKGYTSFLDDVKFETVEGVEPLFDELEYYYLTFAEAAGLPVIDYKMSESVYEKIEAKALDRIKLEQQSADEALARHNEMLGEGA